jgi:hypothetical protein
LFHLIRKIWTKYIKLAKILYIIINMEEVNIMLTCECLKKSNRVVNMSECDPDYYVICGPDVGSDECAPEVNMCAPDYGEDGCMPDCSPSE